MATTARRIGPNAITRVAEALDALFGHAETVAVFARAGLAARLAQPPDRMVDEAEVTALHAALGEQLPAAAATVAADAGRRTADYLLVHRVPGLMRALLPRLPARLAAWILLAVIKRHAWTFAGSGRFAVSRGWPTRFSIAGGPLPRGVAAGAPIRAYYAATFEGLFRALVHPATRVSESAWEACGAPACIFEASWQVTPR